MNKKQCWLTEVVQLSLDSLLYKNTKHDYRNNKIVYQVSFLDEK